MAVAHHPAVTASNVSVPWHCGGVTSAPLLLWSAPAIPFASSDSQGGVVLGACHRRPLLSVMSSFALSSHSPCCCRHPVVVIVAGACSPSFVVGLLVVLALAPSSSFPSPSAAHTPGNAGSCFSEGQDVMSRSAKEGKGGGAYHTLSSPRQLFPVFTPPSTFRKLNPEHLHSYSSRRFWGFLPSQTGICMRRVCK